MSKQGAKNEYRVGVGASSILMVLVVLALTAVGLLAFSTAQNGEALIKRNVEMTKDYYAASAKAQQKLAELDFLLVEKGTAATAQDPASIADDLQQIGLELLENPAMAGKLMFSFVQDAGYERRIVVEGVIAPAEGVRYEVTRYQLVSEPLEDQFDQYQLLGE